MIIHGSYVYIAWTSAALKRTCTVFINYIQLVTCEELPHQVSPEVVSTSCQVVDRELLSITMISFVPLVNCKIFYKVFVILYWFFVIQINASCVKNLYVHYLFSGVPNHCLTILWWEEHLLCCRVLRLPPALPFFSGKRSISFGNP